MCRDLKIYFATSKHLFISKYIATLTLLVATRSVHLLSTLYRDLVFLSCHKLLLQHLFCLNKLFHVEEVSFATDESSIAIDILSSVQHYVATQTILFPTCIYFSHSLSRPVVFCRDLAQLSTIRLWCCDTINVVATLFLW